jgi:hypothetical protein
LSGSPNEPIAISAAVFEEALCSGSPCVGSPSRRKARQRQARRETSSTPFWFSLTRSSPSLLEDRHDRAADGPDFLRPSGVCPSLRGAAELLASSLEP